ncbi:MAG: hypothetical protein JW726_15325 [Anaerolineales bacterium]|nr:hypothetical protein [Anaerolineales bacterium]
MPNSDGRSHLSFKRVLILGLVLVLLGCAGSMAVVEIWPSFAAQVANQLREIFGPRVVAGLETVLFQVQDTVKQWQYRVGGQQAEAPWEEQVTPQEVAPLTPSVTPPPPATRTPTPTVAAEPLATQAGSPAAEEERLTATASPPPSPTPYTWQLADLEPIGALEGEGTWQPYLYDQEGAVVAMRTFLQPDPARPYAIVGVVAFDLSRIRLHYVLGFSDPAPAGAAPHLGMIPEEDRAIGILLAAFNGGFRPENGMFGAMANGVVALPPVDDKATVGIYQNGDVRIGNWGKEILDTPELESWRQNCALVIEEGAISPLVYNDSIRDWGASISNSIVTRRSGIGLDSEAKTLYYFAGPSLSMPALADAMLAAGVHYGMLLDINNFWVHFTAFREQEGSLAAEPLLPNEMIDKIDRYLGASPVDFFYITLRENSEP